MPTNKNAAIRYQALDKCFRDHRHRYYINDLIDACEEALEYYNGTGGVSRSIFPEYLGHITKAIIEFGSVDSHTNEAFPHTIDDKDLSLSENEKELFFSYVLQLCHVIKFFGKFVEQHSDVSANKSMKKVLDAISATASDYNGFEGVIMQDSGNNFFVGNVFYPIKQQ